MASQYYVQINGKYEPINATASNGIRCMTCNKFFDPNNLQQHLNTHIHPTFQKTEQRGSKMGKVNFKSLLQENPQDDIGIKSVMPQDLPKPEVKKKKALSLARQSQGLTDGSLSILELDNSKGDLGLSSHIVDANYFDLEEQGPLEYQRKINFKNETAKVTDKGIHLYESAHNQFEKKDLGGTEQKKLHVHERCSGAYELQKINDEATQTQVESKPRGHQYRIVTSKKYPRASLNISTASKYQPQKYLTTPQKKNIDNESDWTGIKSERRVSPVIHKRFECPECKGFYCDYCKSDIPPIYRPVPDEEGKYHFHPNKQSIEFYREHYYPRINNVCTRCQKKL